MAGAVLVAHGGGVGWDEAIIFAIPIVILVVLQVLGRRRPPPDEDDQVTPDRDHPAP